MSAPVARTIQVHVERSAVLARARRMWVVLASFVLLCYLDWLTHRDVAFLIIAGGLVLTLLLIGPELAEAVGLRAPLSRLPAVVKSLLFAAPGYAYLASRGQGTTDVAAPVIVTGIVIIIVLAVTGEAIDTRLAPFYSARNRVLPRGVRQGLTLVLAIVASFLIIHGDITDLPALFGVGTHTKVKAFFTDSSRFVFGGIVAMLVAVVLLREAPARRAAPVATWPAATAARARGSGVAERTMPAVSPAAFSPPVPGGAAAPSRATAPSGIDPGATLTFAAPAPATRAWTPTHCVPAGGVLAWASPHQATEPGTAVAPGVELAVVEWQGAWARVTGSNGWSGWVDGRLLEAMR